MTYSNNNEPSFKTYLALYNVRPYTLNIIVKILLPNLMADFS
jgi:hypothetical protein